MKHPSIAGMVMIQGVLWLCLLAQGQERPTSPDRSSGNAPAAERPSASGPVGAAPELILDTGGFLSEVADLAFSPDGRSLAVAGDKLVRVFDVDSGDLRITLRGDRSRSSYGSINTVAYSPDGQYLLLGVFDYHPRGSIRVYRTDRLEEIERLLPGHSAPCTFIRFSRDGRFMASSDSDGEICLWDWGNKRVVKRIAPRNPDKPIVDSLQFGDDGKYIITVEHDSPHIYRVPDGREMQPADNMPPKILGWMFDVLTNRVAWPHHTSPDKPARVFDFQLQRNLWGAVGQGTVNSAPKYWAALWSARAMDTNAVANRAKVVYDGHRWQVRALAISPRGDLVATGDKFGEVHLWHAGTGESRQVIKSQGRSIYEAAFDRTSDNIAFGTDIDRTHWGFNRYGIATQAIDLRQRVIRQTNTGVVTMQERPEIGRLQVAPLRTQAGSQSYHIVKQRDGRVVSKYRVPSGRKPSVYTLLEQPALGVQEPVLFGDSEGLLAMWDSSRDEMQRYYHGHQSMVTSISPAANGKVFVTSSTDRTIRIWSLVNHTRTGVFDFRYENSAVIEVKPGTSSAAAGVRVGDRITSVDGKSLQDMYELMMLGKFNYKPGQIVPVVMRRGDRTFSYKMTMAEGFDYVEPLLNIFIGDRAEWIIWTPKGYYDCSPGADRLIGWHVNQGPEKAAKFYRAEQFKTQLYRPDIINAIIDTGDVDLAIQSATASHPHRGHSLDLTDPTSMADNVPPVVAIRSPAQEASDPRVTIEATVTAVNGRPITAVTLLHNGTPAKVFKPAGPDEQKNLVISHRCRLFPGRNEFSFVAANAIATSAPEDARLVLTAPAGVQRPRAYVLAIGISDYKNAGRGFDNLRYAADDAKAFTAGLERHRDGKLYSDIESTVLLNQQATRANVLNGLQWLVNNVTSGDVVILFAACHGFLDKDNFYLATHDVDKESLRATGISWREITGVLHEELPACKRIVFLDACHSAGLVGHDARSPLHDLASAELGTIFYASCTFQQRSFESEEWGHGAFTKSILDLLTDQQADFAPSTGDGLLSTLELESGVSEKVKVITRDRQHPVVFTPSLLRQFNVLELLHTGQ